MKEELPERFPGNQVLTHETDRKYLLEHQYRNGANLNARIELHARFSANRVPWPRWVFDQLDIPPTGTILELGCGPGTLWAENGDRIPAGWSITLSDFSPGMLEEARQNLTAVDHEFKYAVIDAQDIPLPDKSVDAVIANHMLYHISDRPKALAQICRVLRPGGQLYATTNGMDHMRELDELLQSVGLDIPKGHGSFKSENGVEQLVPEFPHVEVRRHEDHLNVTEAEPIMNYILSDLSPDDSQLGEIRRVVEGEIACHGAYYITKSSGMFIARR